MFYYTFHDTALDRQEAYWKKQFSEVPHRVELPLDIPRPPVSSFLRSKVSLTLDPADVEQLFAFCRDKQLIPAQMLLSAYALLLFRYTGQEDFIISTAVYVENDTRQKHSPLVNPIMLKLNLSADMSVHDFLVHLRDTSDAACRNSMYPYDQMAAALDSDATGQDIPLLQHMLITDNVLANHSPESDLQVCIDGLAEYRVLSDLFITAGSGDETVVLTADYNSELFYPETIQRFLKNFGVLLQNMIEYFDTPLATIPMIPPDEYQQMRSPGSTASQHYPSAQCLHQLFEAQVEKTPDAVAAVFQTEQLTYRQINRRANRLAHYLRQCNVGPNTLVGICLERSLEMVVGILGILKAGGAYLPLDPDYPEERLAFMIHDAEVPLIISQQILSPKLGNSGCRIIDLGDDGDKIETQSSDNPENLSSPMDTAYVIYTSGSTGNPKGTLVSHYNVVRLFQATDAWFGFNENDVWTLFHSFAFDFSVWEMWGPLLYGGKLIVISYFTSRSPETFYQLLRSEGVTVLNQTPSAFRQLMAVEPSNSADQILKLRFIIFGGEALEPQTLRPWLDNHSDDNPRLINMYGITETTVHVTYRPITRRDLQSAVRSSIGVPIPDLSLHICDAALNPLPIGVPGEIYVGGSGVAKGYLNRHDLTAERFIADPFSNQSGSRLYKTGDLGRLLPDYDIEYLGRIDQQVKIRGFRIELGEIESVLNGYDGIQESITVVNEDQHGDKNIIAYYVPYKNKDFDIITLKNRLREKLPSYMIPSLLIPIDAFPLTQNGKLDYKALPAPDHSRPQIEQTYVAPSTDRERILSNIWSEVLNLEQVGINDDFFSLGGDSIISLRIIAKAHQAGLKITPQQIFQYPTISLLIPKIQYIDSQHSENNKIYSGIFKLTPIQRWFFEQNFSNLHHWNQSFLFKTKKKLNHNYLQQAMQQLLLHHDCLRLRFSTNNGTEWQQEYSSSEDGIPFSHKDFSELSAEDYRQSVLTTASDLQMALNIEHGPMIQVALFSHNYEGDLLLMIIHHLAIDGVSWQILLNDLESSYHQISSEQPVTLSQKSTSYKHWTDHLLDYSKSKALEREKHFWNEISQQSIAPLPKDFDSECDNLEASADTVTVSFSETTTRHLLTDALKAYSLQINDLLVLALTQTLQNWTSEDKCVFDLEGHGREDLFKGVDLSRTVGWFTSMFPVSIQLPRERNFDTLIKAVKEQLRRTPNKGIGYGILRYCKSNSDHTPPIHQIPARELLFNYLGQLDTFLSNSQLFSLVNSSTGPWHSPENRRTHKLEIIGCVIEGTLEFRFIYCRNCYDLDTITKFAESFKSYLLEAISFCLTTKQIHRTPSDFSLQKVDQQTLDSLSARYTDIIDILPLSPIQKLFFSLDQAQPSLGFEQWSFRITGPLKPDIFKAAWNNVVNRHSVMRSSFVSEGLPQPIQIVSRQVTVPWYFHDLQGLDKAEQQSRIDTMIQADRENPFDLTQPPLTRINLLQRTHNDFSLLWSTHHLEIDGWSWPLVFRDLMRFYDGLLNDPHFSLPPPPSYHDYLEWLQKQNFDDDEPFWRRHLKEFLEPNPLPGMSPPGSMMELRKDFSEIDFCLSEETTERLLQIAKKHKITSGTILQCVWGCLISAATTCDDIVFGVTVSGRPSPVENVDSIVGPFVNNLPVRISFTSQQTLLELLQELQTQQFDLIQHQHTPLPKIQQFSGMSMQNRLFQSLVVYQNYMLDPDSLRTATDVTFTTVSSPQSTNYPLTILAYPGKKLHVHLGFHRTSFHEAIADAIASDLRKALDILSDYLQEEVSSFKAHLTAWKQAAENSPDASHVHSDHLEKKSAVIMPQTEFEMQISSVLQDAFNQKSLSIYDNFFDLGAHSLLLIQVHERLQEILGIKFSITKMFQFPTIQSLAAFLANTNKPDTQLNEIQTRVDRRMDARKKRQDMRKRRIEK